METNHKYQYIESHSIFPAIQGETFGDRLPVDVVALYILGADGSGKEESDFVFQESRQTLIIGDDEPARDAAVTSRDSADRHCNGQTIRKAMQPLHVSRIIGIGLKPPLISDFAQPAKEVVGALREMWQDFEGRSIVFLCHGYGAFLLVNIMDPGQNQDLCQAIAAIGLFGVDPADPACDISKLRKWTAERCKMNPQAPIFMHDYETDFRKALNGLRKDYFVSVFAFRTSSAGEGKMEGSKTTSQNPQTTSYRIPGRDPVWDGGDFDQIATFAGPDDALFRGMCNYLVESIDGHQLLTAARKNEKDVIMDLIRRGANVDSINYTSRDNKTALAIAAEAGHVDIVNFLSTKDYVSLDHGVDIEKSALHCALQSIKDRRGEILESMKTKADRLMPRNRARRIPNQMRDEKRLPLEEEMMSLDDTNKFDRMVKQLVRTVKIVEILLEAGALPTEELEDTMDTNSPFERVAKELLSNPPAVQGPSPRQLVMSSPSQNALQVCRKTLFVIREVFSVGKNGKDRYIPLYTDIEQVIYQGNSSTYDVQPDYVYGLSSHVPSPTGPGSRPTITIQADETATVMARAAPHTQEVPEPSLPHKDSEFDMDKEFSRRGKNSKDAGSKRICRWYHIPKNNMAWVHVRVLLPGVDLSSPKDCSGFICQAECPWPTDEYLDLDEADESPWKTRGDKWMDRLAGFGDLTTHRLSNTTKDNWTHPETHFDFSETYKRYQTRVREELKTNLSNAGDLKALSREATELTNAYLDCKHNSGYKLPLHPRRTLDQSHYYMLRDTTYRDRTQVVSRWFRRNRREQTRQQNHERPTFRNRAGHILFAEEDHNILMVDQLWLWVIEEKRDMHETDKTRGNVTLVTSFPDRVGTKSAAHNNIAQQVFRDSTRDPFHTVSDLVRQIVTVCLRTLNEGRVDGSVTFLECFEISLGNLEDRSAQSFLEFRRLSMFLEHLDEKHPDYLSRRGLLLKLLLRISKDSKILSEVKDVLDEIRMIQGVLQDQEVVLSDRDHEMDYLLGEMKDRAPLYNELRRTLATFEHMKQRAQSIVDSVRFLVVSFGWPMANQDQIERLLDMKQKQANLWEARTSREGSELAAKAGNTLWWFTAVTIIFLPLSFMASFFALDIDKFPKDDDGDTNWPLGLVRYNPKFEQNIELCGGIRANIQVIPPNIEDHTIPLWYRNHGNAPLFSSSLTSPSMRITIPIKMREDHSTSKQAQASRILQSNHILVQSSSFHNADTDIGPGRITPVLPLYTFPPRGRKSLMVAGKLSFSRTHMELASFRERRFEPSHSIKHLNKKLSKQPDYDLSPRLKYQTPELRLVIVRATAAQIQHDTNVYSSEIARAGMDMRTAAASGYRTRSAPEVPLMST
ncbi:hypothetical protein SCUP515_01681 [Seiridium cupressi]